jgi:hypothetical protein
MCCAVHKTGRWKVAGWFGELFEMFGWVLAGRNVLSA